jgi:hypothetical protein
MRQGLLEVKPYFGVDVAPIQAKIIETAPFFHPSHHQWPILASSAGIAFRLSGKICLQAKKFLKYLNHVRDACGGG